jgi:polyisoprenoid-binding protein YceI
VQTSRNIHRCWLPAALFLVGCAHHAPPLPDTIDEPEALPQSVYADAASEGRAVYRVDPMQSLVLMHVSRAGTMKSAGHDHVIASTDIDGYVLIDDDASASRADLRMPLQSLIVDDATYRERYGLEGDVSESTIEGTTRNMQDKVLQSAWYPVVEVHAQFAAARDQPPLLSVAITLHGTTFDYLVPVQLAIEPDKVTVGGSLKVQHSDFGLVPFSAAGGLLKVADEVAVDFELVATRWH